MPCLTAKGASTHLRSLRNTFTAGLTVAPMAMPIQWHVLACPHCLGAPQRADAVKVPTERRGVTIDLCAMCGGHGLVKRRYDLNELKELT